MALPKAPTVIAAADYVRVRLFCAMSGYTPDAVDKKIRAGVWREGVHFVRAPDGHILIHLHSYYAWAEGQEQAA